jgi:hypothetical protein
MRIAFYNILETPEPDKAVMGLFLFSVKARAAFGAEPTEVSPK